MAALGLAIYLLVGDWAVVALFILPVTLEIDSANINLLLALVLVAGFRWPALWSIPLLTKPTLGVGLLWWVVRSEWRPLAIALGATAAVTMVSFAIAPGLWTDWIDAMIRNATAPPPSGGAVYLQAPIVLRLGVAAAVVSWGARTDRRWAVPIAEWIAMPVVWVATASVLLAIGRLKPRSMPLVCAALVGISVSWWVVYVM
jgi:hypothetical protein